MKRILWRLWCRALDLCPDCEQTYDAPGQHALRSCRARCQAIKSVDEARDEYIVCGALAPFDDTRGPLEAHLCAARHQMFLPGVEIKIALGRIGHHGTITEKTE